MFSTLFEKIETTVSHFWRWFFVQEKKLSLLWPWLVSRHKIVALVFIWLGINWFIVQGLYANYQRTILSFQVTPVAQEAMYRAALPTKLVIADVQVDLPIVEANIVDNVWQIPEDSVAHLATSARPGENGNIVMYGHNRWNILASLHQVKVGAAIAVETESGVKHTYTVENIVVVKPTDAQYVLPTKDERLTVYTCTGLFDSQRLIIIALPSNVTSL